MVDKSLRIYKYDSSSKIDFGRWKTKMLAVAAIKGGFDEAYTSDLPVVVDLNAVPLFTADKAKVNVNVKK